MKKFVFVIILSLISAPLFPSKKPEIKYKIGTAPGILANHSDLKDYFEIVFKQYDYHYVDNIDRVLDLSTLKVHTLSNETLILHFLIRKVYYENNNPVGLEIIENGKNKPHIVEASNNWRTNFKDGILKLITLRAENSDNEKEKQISGENDKLFIIGKKYEEMNKIDSALVFYKKSLSQNPQNTEVLLAVSLCYEKLGDKINYKKYIDEALKIDPENAGCILQLGNYFLDYGSTELAIGYYKKVAQDPQCKEKALWNLYLAYTILKKEEEAIKYLQMIPPNSEYSAEANEIILKYNDKVIAEKEINAKKIKKKEELRSGIKLVIRIILIMTCIYFIYRIYRKVNQGTKVREQKFNLIMVIISALTTLIMTLLNDLIK
jgi:tetratricopeptide (TPR) repeat protein